MPLAGTVLFLAYVVGAWILFFILTINVVYQKKLAWKNCSLCRSSLPFVEIHFTRKQAVFIYLSNAQRL